MRRFLAAGLALAAVATHGMVSSAMDMSHLQPVSTYRGFFQQIVLWLWRIWSEAHGWKGAPDLVWANHPISVLDDFARFYAHTVLLVCPLLGFWAFSLTARVRPGRLLWKPLAVAIAFATPLQEIIRTPALSAGLNEEWAQVVRTIVVVVLMAWSVGAVRTQTRPRRSAAPLSAVV